MTGTVAGECVCALIKLEPLLGTAIVLNVAYIGLPEFSFIQNFRRRVIAMLKSLDDAVTVHFMVRPWFNAMLTLSESLDAEAGFGNSSRWWVPLPRFWGFLFNILFKLKVSRALSIASVSYALVLLVMAVGDEAGVFHLDPCYYSASHLVEEFGWLLAATLWPVFAVGMGWFIQNRAAAFIRSETEGVTDAALHDAGDQLQAVKQRLAAI